MNAVYSIQSSCECQAVLGATFDATRQVLGGWAAAGGERESAPAHVIGAPEERFDVAWHCPFCGRNTLRSVHAATLSRVSA